MSEQSISLRRNFSNLGRFQQAHSLIYAMTDVGNGTLYDFCVETVRDGDSHEKFQAVLNISFNEAEQFLCFLYENGIEANLVPDIIQDFACESI